MCARRLALAALFAPTALVSSPGPARAVDEIQVYNAEIADIGVSTIQQHLNYVFRGRGVPDFPGGLISNRSLNGTPEYAYGVTNWYEIGLYAPFSVQSNGVFYGQGVKLRHLFVVPDAAKRELFYGVNFEFSYNTPRFAPTPFALEIRPIIGIRKYDWEFIVNPIVDMELGGSGEADFVPAARLARRVGEDVWVGLEYYADFGRIGHFSPLADQSHQLFAVVDFPIGKFDIDLGIGYGFTRGSDGLVAKAIVGYAFEAGPQAGPLRAPNAHPQH